MNANAAIANVLCPESRQFRRWTHTQTFSFHRAVFCLTFIAALLLATPMLLLDDIYLRYRNQPTEDSRAAGSGRERSEDQRTAAIEKKIAKRPQKARGSHGDGGGQREQRNDLTNNNPFRKR